MMSELDELDRRIVNALQGGFPLSERPYADAGHELGIDEETLIERLGAMLKQGFVSRFGPLWNPEGLGGAVCLAAMAVPPDRFDAVLAIVNAHPEVAHNYEREHELNMWFVLSSLDRARVEATAREIEAETGFEVKLMPKEREYFVGFRVEA